MARAVEVLHEGLDFGEGPRWHDGRLWLSDFFRHAVLSIGPTGDTRVELELDDQPSGLGWLPSGELLVVAMLSQQVRRVTADGTVHLHADLSSLATGPCNDMVVDGRGNAYVGNFGFDLEGRVTPRTADLALVRPDGRVEVAAPDLLFPNGTVVTPDGTTLIVGESMGARYVAFTIADDGSLHDKRVWAEVPGRGPDGCTLDADGAIWVADAGGGGCFRVAEGGEVLDHVEASQPVFACALGGPERRTLHLITAPGFGSDRAGQGEGKVEVVDVDVPGAGWP
jgi:sugar lactone lactonase YvrE